MAADGRDPSQASKEPSPLATGDRTEGPVLLATMIRRSTTVGVATHMTQVVELLQGRGVTAEIVRPTWPGPLRNAALLSPTTALRLVTHGEAAVRFDRLAYQRLLEQALRRRFRVTVPRVVYAQDPRSAAAALKVRGDARVPVIMVVHYNDSQAQELVERGAITAGGTSDRRIRAFEAQVLPRLDGLIYVSDYMRERVSRAVPAVADVPSVVIPNFLEDEPVTASSATRGTPSLRDCITVGSLVERKNHLYLLEVLAAARQDGHTPTLTIVGGGPLRASLEARAEALGVGDQVLFTGGRSDVAALLRQHRIYVHSATMENLPYALIEAFRAGLPVVAGRVGGIGEMLRDDQTGRFWPLDDPVTGAKVLTSLLTDGPGLEHASLRARQAFEERYSVSAAGRALADFLLLSAAR